MTPPRCTHCLRGIRIWIAGRPLCGLCGESWEDLPEVIEAHQERRRALRRMVEKVHSDRGSPLSRLVMPESTEIPEGATEVRHSAEGTFAVGPDIPVTRIIPEGGLAAQHPRVEPGTQAGEQGRSLHATVPPASHPPRASPVSDPTPDLAALNLQQGKERL